MKMVVQAFSFALFVFSVLSVSSVAKLAFKIEHHRVHLVGAIWESIAEEADLLRSRLLATSLIGDARI